MSPTSKLAVLWIAILGLTAGATGPVLAQSSITCGPLDNGRIADVFYKSSAIFFDPVVEYEYESAVLTISGPCENITRTFEPGEEIFFDLGQVERVLDGQYGWQLRFNPAVDPGVRKELTAARGSGEEDDIWWSFWQKGAIPAGPSRDSGGFTVVEGGIVDPSLGERSGSVAAKGDATAAAVATAAAGFEAAGSSPSASTAASPSSASDRATLATKDFVINDDLIVIGSQCLGFDCVNGESFGFDTLRLKENNTRIQFNDTSGGSFPTQNWQIRANSSANGGQTYLGFLDQGSNGNSESGDLVFAVEGNAPTNALYVESSGDVGLGTSNPVVDLHVTSGDSPALRLDQNTSSGFASQVWDIAGNETNFFVRDATNGSTLPFRIRPGADSSSIFIDTDSSVGIGTSSPAQDFHVTDRGDSNSNTAFRLSTSSHAWDFATIQTNGAFRISKEGTGSTEFNLSSTGDLTITGEIFTNGSCSSGCDRVFSPVYDLESIEEHAELMWAKSHLPGVGPTAEEGPFNLSQKTLGILNELEKAHIYISELNSRLDEKESHLAEFQVLNQDLSDRQIRLEEELAHLKELVRNLGGSE